MTTAFRTITKDFAVSPQISVEDVQAAASAGYRLIVNNRPDGEAPGQPASASIESAAKEAGLSFVAIPIGPQGISAADLDALDAAVAAAGGPALAYCASGTRSTVVYSMARARAGDDIDGIIANAAEAGYDLAGHRPLLAAAQRGGI